MKTTTNAYIAALDDPREEHLQEPAGAILRFDRSAPLPYSVWLDDEIIGAGHRRSTAVAEALEQIRKWNEQ